MKLKKLFRIGLLALAFLFATSAAVARAELPSPNSPRHGNQEFGSKTALINHTKPLLAHIRYPYTQTFADAALEQWAKSTYEALKQEFEEVQSRHEKLEGEINISFASYLHQDSYGSVIEKGTYRHSKQDSPKHVLKSFNFDLKNELLLSLDDVVAPAYQEEIVAKLKEKIAAAHPKDKVLDASVSWLEHHVLTEDGLKIFLETAKAIKGGKGVTEALLSFEELGEALLLRLPGSAVSNSTADLASESIPTFRQLSDIDPERPVIALTFDDGPSVYTLQILELLAQYDVNATFFVLGENIGAHPGIVKMASQLGNEVLGHTWSHFELTKLSEDEIKDEIMRTEYALDQLTGGNRPPLFRPPYGAFDDKVKEVVADLGMAMIFWTVDSLDWQSQDPVAIWYEVMNQLKDGSVVLFHDLYPTTVTAIKWLIPDMIERGYQFVTISELMELKGQEFVPGTVYFTE